MHGITRKSLAHALSIVGEAGRDGFEYDGVVPAMTGSLFRSNKLRWTLAPSPSFTWKEFSFHLSYAAKDGFISSDRDLRRIANGEILLRKVNLSLTLKGWEHIETYDVPLIERWYSNVRDNIPSIIFAVLIALLADHFIGWFGYQAVDVTETEGLLDAN